MSTEPEGGQPWLARVRDAATSFYGDPDAEGRTMHAVHRESQTERTEDFEALKRAALKGTKRKKEEDEASKLSRDQKRDLLSGVFEVEGNDSQRLAEKIRERLARVGMATPTILVRYRNLSVIASVKVGNVTVPTITAASTAPLQPVLRKVNMSHPIAKYPILDGVSGILKPGRLTLLLGPPGAGKSTFLKTLAGYNRREAGIKITHDELTYNGRTFDEFVVERSSAYVSQIENHYGELTVRETFDFAARCQSAGYKTGQLEELAAREKEAGITPDPDVEAFMRGINQSRGASSSLMVELVIRLLGLDVCADTIVGNAMLRGISGGQKKRVTTGELIVGPARALFMDEISTGLDSNTTFTIVRTLGALCHSLHTTVLIGLLQPSPETFDLFDDVVLIASARTPYNGTREDALPFFEGLGFYCPGRTGVADFLQEVATPNDQAKYWNPASPTPHKYLTVATLGKSWEATPQWQSTLAELQQPVNKDEFTTGALHKHAHAQAYRELLMACMWRWWTLTKRGFIFTIFRTTQLMLMAFVTGTLFIQMKRDNLLDGQHFMSVIFYSLLYMLLPTLADMHILVARLSVMFRQRNARFYPGWCFAVPPILLRIPFSFLESTIWTMIVYWLCGFTASGRVVMFWFQLLLINLWSVIFFDLVGAIMRDDTVGTAVNSFFLLIFINLAGFVLNSADIPGWWLGGFWGNPFAYVFRALCINEFTSWHWDWVYPLQPQDTLGRVMLRSRGFGAEYWWCWVSFAFMIGTGICNFLALVGAITFLEEPHRQPVLSEELLEEMATAREDITITTEGDERTVVVSRLSEATEGEGRRGSAILGMSRNSANMSITERAGASQAAGEVYSSRTALPFTPMVLSFKDVEYSVPVPPSADRSKADIVNEGPHAGNLRLLKHIDGIFRPHVLTALMGASGAGKTTLMDVLASRKTGGVITGDIRVNGHPQVPKTFARVMGYVEQTDIHVPQTTVEEALQFSAALRLPHNTDATTRKAFVAEIMELVELDRLANAYVGNPGHDGLSVEQRKRLTLGVELVANPSIVFMDEPTSGLDARAAAIVMRAVRNTVDSGRTVVCTIHQPSIDIFQAFDELLLLKPGGRTIYNGEIGDDSVHLIKYFEGLSGVRPIRERYNPANWMLEETNPEAETRLGVDFNDLYFGSEMLTRVQSLLAEHSEPKADTPDIDYSKLDIAGPWYQFQVIFKRNLNTYWRCPSYNVTRFGITLLVALCFGSMFYRFGKDRATVNDVLNVMGVIYASTLFMGIINCLTVQHLVAVQRTVFYRERAAGIYGVLPFGMAQQLVEVPYVLVQGTVYVVIVYWMIYFEADAGKFFWFWWLFCLTLLYFTFFGIMGISLVPSVAFASNVCNFFIGFWNIVAGFLIAKPEIPGWWIWAYYINPAAWSIYGLITTQLGNLKNMYITNLFGVTMTVPEYLKDSFGFSRTLEGPIVAILIGYSVLFSAVTVFALAKLNFQNR